MPEVAKVMTTKPEADKEEKIARTTRNEGW